MRLLRCLWTGNNETAVEVAFEEHGDPIPPYEYLSHRWGNDEDEVSYASLLYKIGMFTDEAGHTKLAARRSFGDGYHYV